MLRITRQSSERGEVLRLEGKLLAPWVTELESCLASWPVGTPILLDLTSLSYCDAVGVRALRSTLQTGSQVVACSGYIKALLWGDQACQL